MNNLKILRKSKNLSQKDIALIAHVSTSTYSYWENGTYDIDNNSLILLADYYNVTTDYILGRSNDKSQKITTNKIYKTKNDNNLFKALRIKTGLTQAQVAQKLNLNTSTISKWESGNTMPDQSILPQVAELYNTTIDYLFEGKNGKKQFNFGAILKNLRTQNALTQIQLAEILHSDRTTIAKWENGTNTPPMETIKMLADYFNVTVDYLIGRKTLIPVHSEYGDIPTIFFDEAKNLSQEDINAVIDFMQYLKFKKKIK